MTLSNPTPAEASNVGGPGRATSTPARAGAEPRHRGAPGAAGDRASNRLSPRMYSLAPETAWSAIAPGAAVALAAVALWWLLARWYDRVPRRVLAVFALVLAAFYGRVLVGGGVLLPLDNLRGEPPFTALPAAEPHGNLLQGDLLYLVEPLRAEVRRAVAAGAWPLWAPRLGAGQPLLADPQAQAVQPLVLVDLAVAGAAGPLGAPAAVAALRTFVALLFAYLLLSRLGAGTGPALAGSLAYGLGGFLQLWLGWPLANSAAWLPAVLYALVRVAEEGRRRDEALLAAALFASLTAGHPETIALTLALAGALVALRLLRRAAPAGGRGAFARRAATGLALALLVAAPALLPFAAHLPETLRWSRVTAERGPATVEAAPAAPATRWVQVAAPQALGNSRYVHYWGLANSNEDTGGFVGTATLLAALLALPLAVRRGAGPLAHERAAAGLALLCLLLLALPGPSGDGLSGRLALPLDLALAVLAAATLERCRRGTLPRWWTWGALPAAALLLAAAHVWIVPAFAHPGDPALLEVLRAGWRHWHLRFLAAAGAALFVAGAALAERRSGRRLALRRGRFVLREIAVVAVAFLVAAELWLAHAPVNPPMPRSLTSDGSFPRAPVLGALAAAGPGGAGPTRLAAGGRVFLPNLAAVYGLGDARVFDPMAPAPYLRRLAPAIARWTGEIPLLGAEGESGAGAARARLYDRLGVAWWLSAPEAPCPPGTAAVYEGPDARLCRRPGARALVRVTGGAGGGERPAKVAAGAAGDRWRIELDPAGAPAAEPSPERIETALYAAPGWRAVADGRRIGVGSDDALLTAELPAGSRRADLLYRPAPFVAGCLLAALGLALALARLAPPPARWGPIAVD